jgi:hypothetical protein
MATTKITFTNASGEIEEMVHGKTVFIVENAKGVQSAYTYEGDMIVPFTNMPDNFISITYEDLTDEEIEDDESVENDFSFLLD